MINQFLSPNIALFLYFKDSHIMLLYYLISKFAYKVCHIYYHVGMPDVIAQYFTELHKCVY